MQWTRTKVTTRRNSRAELLHWFSANLSFKTKLRKRHDHVHGEKNNGLYNLSDTFLLVNSSLKFNVPRCRTIRIPIAIITFVTVVVVVIGVYINVFVNERHIGAVEYKRKKKMTYCEWVKALEGKHSVTNIKQLIHRNKSGLVCGRVSSGWRLIATSVGPPTSVWLFVWSLSGCPTDGGLLSFGLLKTGWSDTESCHLQIQDQSFPTVGQRWYYKEICVF